MKTAQEIKQEILETLEKKHGIGKVKIYPNGSIFSKGILLGTLSEFSSKFELSSEQKNEQKMMDTGYAQYD